MCDLTPVPRDRIGRPVIQTRHSVFNQQILHQELRPGPITNKNVVGRYIREQGCLVDVDGTVKAPGELTALDLEDFGHIPPKILAEILDLTIEKPIFLYELRYLKKNIRKNHRVGFLAAHAVNHRYLKHWVTTTGYQARHIVEDVRPYLTASP